MNQPTVNRKPCQVFLIARALFSLALLPVAVGRLFAATFALGLVSVAYRAAQRARGFEPLSYGAADDGLTYADDLPSDALPTIPVRAVCLEPLYAKRGARYVETADLGQPVFRKTLVGSRTRYVAVGV
jgi:hypothetical protein